MRKNSLCPKRRNHTYPSAIPIPALPCVGCWRRTETRRRRSCSRSRRAPSCASPPAWRKNTGRRRRSPPRLRACTPSRPSAETPATTRANTPSSRSVRSPSAASFPPAIPSSTPAPRPAAKACSCLKSARRSPPRAAPAPRRTHPKLLPPHAPRKRSHRLPRFFYL